MSDGGGGGRGRGKEERECMTEREGVQGKEKFQTQKARPKQTGLHFVVSFSRKCNCERAALLLFYFFVLFIFLFFF